MQEYIKIHEKDNVAVMLRDFTKGEKILINEKEIVLKEDIDRGHKVALKDFEKGESVIKYAFPIGKTLEPVRQGDHIHTHNLKTGLGENEDYTYEPTYRQSPAYPIPDSLRYFMGYERSDQRAGIRNELWIIPTVGCVNSIAKVIADRCKDFLCDNIEAVIPFSHPYGCSQMGEDQENTRKILANLVNHPNAGGVLLLGLGCENSNIEVLTPYLGDYDKNRVRFLQCQDVEDEVEEGVILMRQLAENASLCHRTRIPVTKLVVGLKCGGSDGLSGITANPAVGVLSDILIAAGGSTILTEVPEMFGAETILMNRCRDASVFDKTVRLINDFKEYFRSNHQTIYENPSPGNKQGGISTLEDKALGCTQKSGSSEVVDVLDYGGKVEKAGLNLLYAPGNDLVASTALAAAGAQIVLFTTGRGTPFAGVVPTVKLSSNLPLAQKKRGWIDFDCGRVLEDGMTMDMLGMELYEYVLLVAGGQQVKSEENGYCDLAIFKQGVTL